MYVITTYTSSYYINRCQWSMHASIYIYRYIWISNSIYVRRCSHGNMKYCTYVVDCGYLGLSTFVRTQQTMLPSFIEGRVQTDEMGESKIK